MKISTVLDYIDNGHMALPEFQRGYVWSREQVRGLFGSLYRRHPVGGLLVWATEARTASHRGDGQLASGTVKLLLDGQQRMTSLYGVARGKPPAFFDGNPQAFTGLQFHLQSEAFEFYQPLKMSGDPLWIDVSGLLQAGQVGLGTILSRLSLDPAYTEELPSFIGRLSQLLSIYDIDFHIEEVAGPDKTLDVVVDIFNKVNSGGTKLSKGDLALAKICADWPDARSEMKSKLATWASHGYDFNLDWLLRSINTVLTGEAKFQFLHDQSAETVQAGLTRATRQIDSCLNLIAGRLGLDHARVLFGRFAIPVMVRYLDQHGGSLDAAERDKLLFWFAQSGMWGRYSNSTESTLDADLATLEGPDGGLDKLLGQLRQWHGSLRVEPAHFTGWSIGARFYPILYMLTRMGGARDWGTGLELKSGLLGKMSRLEVHHIYPKSRLYDRRYARPLVNALGNYCFLQKETNLDITNRFPEDYFPEVEAKHPGALASQWIPDDPQLWRIDRYEEFLEARKELLAKEANRRFADLLHGEEQWLGGAAAERSLPTLSAVGGVTSAEEEAELVGLNAWAAQQGFVEGSIAFDYSDVATGAQIAVLDLAWPEGLQPGLSEPVAVLFNESEATLALASAAGYRCFTDPGAFKHYVGRELLNDRLAA